ncbi:hypothetical protein RDV78_03760 [Bacillota bacterium LX-D]|nr:hypothetical protein [Bacillota bacterium LX-D]
MSEKDHETIEVWRKEAENLEDSREEMREKFLREVGQRTEGISADREKFIHGLYTGSHKVLPPNKEN